MLWTFRTVTQLALHTHTVQNMLYIHTAYSSHCPNTHPYSLPGLYLKVPANKTEAKGYHSRPCLSLPFSPLLSLSLTRTKPRSRPNTSLVPSQNPGSSSSLLVYLWRWKTVGSGQSWRCLINVLSNIIITFHFKMYLFFIDFVFAQ